jgi:hypothetical protein
VHARNFRNVSLCNINGKVRGHPTILVCFSKVWLVCFLVLHKPALFSTFVVLHHDLLSVLELLIVLYTVPLCMVPRPASFWCSTMLSSVPCCLTAGFVGSDAVLSGQPVVHVWLRGKDLRMKGNHMLIQ